MENKNHSVITVDLLAERYREAWLVARRIPSGIHLGHSSFWPEFNPNRWEVYHSDDVKIKSAAPSAESVDRMVECMRWLRWLSEDERELVWLRASGMSWRVIAEELGLNRKTPMTRWSKAMNRLKIHLLQNNSG